MKVLTVLLIFFNLILNAQNSNLINIRWNYNYEKALIEAKKTDKNLMLLVTKKESVESKYLLSETLKDNNVISKISADYICVIVIFEDENSYPIELFYTQTFPTLFFINTLDELYLSKPLSGHISAKELLRKLNAISLP